MAYALVAGVNPIYGLYTGLLTTIVGFLTASTSLVIVSLSNALALVTGERLAGLGGDVDPIRALFTLTFLVGVFIFALGALKLGSVIRINFRGNLFFASVDSFDELLPKPDEAKNAVVIVRIRDRRLASLTGLEWLGKYHEKLEATGNQLMLSGVRSDFMEILTMAKAVERLGAENIFPVEPQHFASTEKALEAAEARIAVNEGSMV